MTSPPSEAVVAPKQPAGGGGRAWKVALLAGLAVVSYPTPFVVYGDGIDPGWIYAINKATADGLVYGREFAFTYGPLGFVCFPDDVGTNRAVAAVARTALRAVWVLSIGLLVWPLPLWRTAAFVAGASLTAVPIYDDYVLNLDCIGTTLCSCVYLLVAASSGGRVWPAAVAAAVAGTAAMLKLNTGAACGGAVVGYCLAGGLTRGWRTGARRLVLVLPICGVTASALYVAFGGGFGDLPGYVRSSMLVGDGYTSHVSLPDAVIDLGLGPWPAAHIVAAAAGLTALTVALAGWAQPNLVPVILIAAFPLFATYKSAVVRCDAPHWNPAVNTAVAVLSVFVVRAMSLRVAAGGIALALTATAILVDALSSVSFVNRLLGAPVAIQQTAKWAASGDFRRALVESDDAGIILPLFFIPKVRPEPWVKTLDRVAVYDIYPHNLTLAKDGGLNWRPRVVPQSYLAYHPILDDASAETYRRPNAPEYVIFHYEVIEGYHPFAIDPLTLTELIRWYAPDRRLDHQYLLLRRRPAAGLGAETPVASGVALPGVPIPVPAVGPDEIAFLGLRYTPTAYGRAANLAYRVENPRVTIRYADGTAADRAVGWRNAISGFPASHLPLDLDAAQAFFEGRDAARVSAVTLHPHPAYGGEVAYEWRKAARK